MYDGFLMLYMNFFEVVIIRLKRNKFVLGVKILDIIDLDFKL